MMDLSVVVLPAPLRPRSVTTSPAWTSKSTPCRICDSSYQAWRSRTVRSVGAPAAAPAAPAGRVTVSLMALPHVGLDHVAVPGHARVVPLGQDLPAGEHGDGVGQVLDHAQVVLDHEHRAVGGHLLNQR